MGNTFEFRCHECYIRAKLPDFIDMISFDHAFDVAQQHLTACVGPIHICWERVDGRATKFVIVDKEDGLARDIETCTPY